MNIIQDNLKKLRSRKKGRLSEREWDALTIQIDKFEKAASETFDPGR